jgi:hypothetical protein
MQTGQALPASFEHSVVVRQHDQPTAPFADPRQRLDVRRWLPAPLEGGDHREAHGRVVLPHAAVERARRAVVGDFQHLRAQELAPVRLPVARSQLPEDLRPSPGDHVPTQHDAPLSPPDRQRHRQVVGHFAPRLPVDEFGEDLTCVFAVPPRAGQLPFGLAPGQRARGDRRDDVRTPLCRPLRPTRPRLGDAEPSSRAPR